MKTATLPSVRVTPALRDAAETVLNEGETLSSFLETALKESIHKRQVQKEFIARGLAAGEEAKRTGVYVEAEVVLAKLRSILADAKRKKAHKV